MFIVYTLSQNGDVIINVHCLYSPVTGVIVFTVCTVTGDKQSFVFCLLSLVMDVIICVHCTVTDDM